MTSETIDKQLKDQRLHLHKEVYVTWTQSGTSYQGKGRIVALNAREATIELLQPVARNYEHHAGDRIQVPRHAYRLRGSSPCSVRDIPEKPFIHKDFL